MSIGRFEKLQNIPWNLLGHAPVQGCTYAQERPEKTLIYHLWLTLGIDHENQKALVNGNPGGRWA